MKALIAPLIFNGFFLFYPSLPASVLLYDFIFLSSMSHFELNQYFAIFSHISLMNSKYSHKYTHAHRFYILVQTLFILTRTNKPNSYKCGDRTQ